MVQDDDVVAQVQGQVHDVGGQQDDVLTLDAPQQSLHLVGHHHVEGRQRLIQQQHGGICHNVHQHLHFVFHAVGEVLQQLSPVGLIDAHVVQIHIRGLGIGNPVPVDLQEELQKFPGGEKLRHHWGGQHIAHVVCGDGTGVPAVVHQVEGAAVPGQILVETIEKRGLSRAVAADQTVDLSLFKGEGRAPQHLLVTEPLLQVLDYQLRGQQPTMPVRARGLPSRHRRSRP